MNDNHVMSEPSFTPSGRRINPGKKLGRPSGSVSTVETKLAEVLRVLLGSDSEKVIQVLREQGCGFTLEQNVGISVKWAESRGYVFKQKDIIQVEVPNAERPRLASLDCSVETFED